jgi:hypothetical protein
MPPTMNRVVSAHRSGRTAEFIPSGSARSGFAAVTDTVTERSPAGRRYGRIHEGEHNAWRQWK